MAEVHAPSPVRRSGTGVLVCVVVLIAGMLVGHRDWFTRKSLATRPISSSVPPARIVPATAHDSMNFAEYGLFRLLEAVETDVTFRWRGSWGWAIILLTGAINVLLLPLRIYSMRSGLKMQRIQPEMDEIRARYKGLSLTDPRRNEMNTEIVQLQKRNGINAFGGCLPLLLQLPLLYAFFGMLRHAEVLRGAGWLWLHDLAAADPSHLMPLTMLILQVLVQWYSPSPGVDAQQRKTMAVVTTLAFGYVSWQYASGLALYAVTGSVLSLMLQLAVNQSSMAKEMKPVHEHTSP